LPYTINKKNIKDAGNYQSSEKFLRSVIIKSGIFIEIKRHNVSNRVSNKKGRQQWSAESLE